MTIVFAAVLAMIVLVLIPARDGHAGWNAVDLTGLGVAVGSLITVVALQHRNRPGENG